MSNRERYIALAAISFIGIAIVYSFIIDPIAKEWQTLNSEMESKSASLKRDLNMLSAKPSLESNYSKFAKYVKSDKNEEGAVADLLSYLESLSRSDSCLVINIKPIGTKDLRIIMKELPENRLLFQNNRIRINILARIISGEK